MDARRKAAAVSAAGMLLIAGCSGGKGGGTSLPVPGGQTQGLPPANSAKVSFSFQTAGRANRSWPNSDRIRRTTPTKKVASQAAHGGVGFGGTRRTAQSVSPAVIGGSVSIFIYQGNTLALKDGPFTVGATPTGYDFYCQLNPNTYQFYCTNTSPVFAPYGNDTFFVAMYDSKQHLLSITPGMPGSGFLPQTQPSYNVTSSGYPGGITVNTYAVLSNFAIDAPTSCIDRSFSGLYVATAPLDGGGDPVFGTIANPVTVSTSGGFNLAVSQLTSPYTTTVTSSFTMYDTSAYAIQVFANSTGSSGSLAVSGNNVLINTKAQSMNLIAVDRLALAPVTGGTLNVLGLVDSTSSTYPCGPLSLATYDTATPVTFSNPVAVGEDDFFPGAVVVENRSGTPYATVIDMYRASFGFGFETGFVPALPVISSPLSGANPLEVAVSPVSFGNGKIYVLNADGSIQMIDTTSGAIATVEAAASILNPSGIDVMYTGPAAGYDSLLVSSSSSNNLYEIDNANTTPNLMMFGLSGSAVIPVSSSATSTAVIADNLDGQGNFLIRGNDPLASPQNIILSCFYPCATDFSLNATQFGSVGQAAEGPGTIGVAAYGGSTYALIASGSSILPFWNFYDNPPQAGGPFNGSFSSTVTRVVSTYDGVWNAFGYGGAFVFTYQLGQTIYVPSLTGTRATIVSP